MSCYYYNRKEHLEEPNNQREALKKITDTISKTLSLG